MISHIKCFYAILGLSNNTMYDQVTGKDVPFKLTQAEQNSILQLLEPKDKINLVYEALDYFKDVETLYYKPSRYIESTLKSLDVKKELNEHLKHYEALASWCFESR